MTLSARDKTPKPFGHNFHHADPQRRVPCAIGDLLAPLSADDIPPITPEAMASVQAALALLAAMISDRDHNLFMGCSQRQDELTSKAGDILLAARGLAGILRVESAVADVPGEIHVSLPKEEIEALQKTREHVRVHMAHEHPWEIRDAAMTAIGKVLEAARVAASPKLA